MHISFFSRFFTAFWATNQKKRTEKQSCTLRLVNLVSPRYSYSPFEEYDVPVESRFPEAIPKGSHDGSMGRLHIYL